MNNEFNEILKQDCSLNSILQQAKQQRSINISGMEEGFKSVFLSFLASGIKSNIIYITSTDFSAKKMFGNFKNNSGVFLYPSAGLYSGISAAHDRVMDYERILTLCSLKEDKKKLILTSAEALSFPISENIYDYIIKIKISDKFDISVLSLDLINLGYERCEVTESKGQFSIRGSIIDIFPINSENPIRIDFFGDEIESIKYFDADNQTSLYTIDNAEIYPCKEVIYTKEEENKILTLASDEIEKRLNTVKKLSENNSFKEEVANNLNQLRNSVLARSFYLSAFTNKSVNFLSYTKDAIIVIDSINSIKEGYSDHIKNYILLYSNLYEKGKAFACETDALFKFEKLLEIIQQKQVLYTEQLYSQKHNTDLNIDLNVRNTVNYFKTYQSCKDALTSYINNKYKIVFCILKDKEKENIAQIISSYELKENADINYINCDIEQGFELYKSKIVFISASEILKTHTKKTSTAKDTKDKLKFFSDIAPGDYVVHDIFGIGKYKGCEQILSEGVRKDFAVIEYAQESMMYVPLDQMHTVSKYIGNSDNAPRLSKLGSTEWKESKAKTKRAVEQMAEELLELYSKREQAQGYAFAKDSVWQSEFENAFIYEETGEQLKCIDEIKADMEDIRPMDRLLCGDVGYGKTEIAQRAAFKAVDNSKQVAILVPTTVLALQHYKNFCERFSSFPITIEMMSRFKTKAQQTEIAKRIKAGKIDILIGTHRILSDDVAFKDLGLLIIDEEQRFGVAHKEKIKQYKTNIDVLTLTATPIPRTLHMSMIGIRDISIINEPPKNRYPVITFVMEYDDSIVKNAIYKELSHGGQVYYIYNKVKGIEQKAQALQTLIPDAKIAYAHGQMAEAKLEKLMADFIERKYDVFLSTTIVENGLDIPTANTMIIEDAHKMGLSQLYQLKGRVGRSDRQAYAYITYPPNKILPQDAEKRLKAIKDFTSFGSGHKIALRDLQIRGAGNILGLDQSGHFGDVGYEMYSRILKEVILQAKGIKAEEDKYTEIDLLINAYVPEHYIPSSSQRMELYKDIASIESKQHMEELKLSLTDRYGKIPIATDNLLLIGYLKNLACNLDIEKIKQDKNIIKIIPYITFDASVLTKLYKNFTFKVITTKKQNNEIHFNNTTLLSMPEYVKKVLESIFALKNLN